MFSSVLLVVLTCSERNQCVNFYTIKRMRAFMRTEPAMSVHVHVHLILVPLSFSAEPLGALGCLYLFPNSPIAKLGVLAGLTIEHRYLQNDLSLLPKRSSLSPSSRPGGVQQQTCFNSSEELFCKHFLCCCQIPIRVGLVSAPETKGPRSMSFGPCFFYVRFLAALKFSARESYAHEIAAVSLRDLGLDFSRKDFSIEKHHVRTYVIATSPSMLFQPICSFAPFHLFSGRRDLKQPRSVATIILTRSSTSHRDANQRDWRY